MHYNAETIDLTTLSEQFDLCIVGAGPAGITLAKAFLGSSLKVCLLESGGFEVNQKTQQLAGGEVDGPSPKIETDYLSLHSQRRFGGTGTIWGGYCREMDQIDFEQRGLAGKHSWPLNKQDLQPYYSKELVDKKYPDKPLQGCGLQLKYFERTQLPFDLVYHKTFLQAENIVLLTQATVVDLVLRESNTMQSLSIATQKGRQFSIQSKQFVLACGGAGNVKLLLNANKQQTHGLGNQHGNVGRYFMEHPHFQFYKPPGMVWLHNDIVQQLHHDKRYKPCLTLNDEEIRKQGLLNFALLLSAPLTEKSKWAGFVNLENSTIDNSVFLYAYDHKTKRLCQGKKIMLPAYRKHVKKFKYKR